jgi:tetratricopeptide (TPR) repeat protein
MNYLSPVFALFLVLASATAWAQTPAVAPPAKEGDNLPKQDLTGQILYQFLLAEIAAQRGQLGFSAGAYLDLAKSTRDPRIVRRATEIAFHARQYDAALEAARLWLSIEPDSQQARQMHSTLLLASGRIDELAGSLARDLAAEGPRAGEVLMRFMRAFVRYPDRLAIQRLFDQLTQPYLGLAEARFVRAQAAAGAGDADRARSEIDRALELRPDWDLLHLFKAELLPKGAAQLDYLQTWLASEFRTPRKFVSAMPARWSAIKRYDDARTEFRQPACPPIPTTRTFCTRWVFCRLQVNDAAEAEQQLKRFVELGRGDLNPARFYLGQIAEQAQRFEDAIRWFDQVEAGENVLPAKIRAARILARQKKLDEARERLGAARATMPGEVRLTGGRGPVVARCRAPSGSLRLPRQVPGGPARSG